LLRGNCGLTLCLLSLRGLALCGLACFGLTLCLRLLCLSSLLGLALLLILLLAQCRLALPIGNEPCDATDDEQRGDAAEPPEYRRASAGNQCSFPQHGTSPPKDVVASTAYEPGKQR
jgi:hypothetical protein